MSIMKMKNIISQLLRGGLLCVAITAFVTSCSTDEITYATGQKPDKETLETVAGTLRSSKSLRDRVPIHLTEGNEDAVSDKIYYRLNQAASQALTLTATPNPSLVADYNADNKANLQPLPVANIKLANGGKTSFGKTRFDNRIRRIDAGHLSDASRCQYLRKRAACALLRGNCSGIR